MCWERPKDRWKCQIDWKDWVAPTSNDFSLYGTSPHVALPPKQPGLPNIVRIFVKMGETYSGLSKPDFFSVLKEVVASRLDAEPVSHQE